MKFQKVYKKKRIIKLCTAFCSVIISYIITEMPNKKTNTNFNTPEYRRWEQTNYNISVNPDYKGNDIFDFKIGGQHFKTKIRGLNR